MPPRKPIEQSKNQKTTPITKTDPKQQTLAMSKKPDSLKA